MTYGIRITAPRKKFNQAIACMKRYGGEFDGRSKMWVFDDRPHAACTAWGDIVEIDDDQPTDIDWDR